MKGNDEYHTSIKVSSTGKVQRYSEKAYEALSAAVTAEGADKLWTHAKQGKLLDPRTYLPEPKAIATTTVQEQTA